MHRRTFLAAAAGFCCGCAVRSTSNEDAGTRPATSPAGRPGGRMIIENVDRYRIVEPMFEAIRVVLAHRGERYSPEYIQGISGAAFRIAGICPCAPTCSSQMEPAALVKLLGYEHEGLILGWKDDDKDAREQLEKNTHNMIDRVKDSIRAGRPVLVWHAFTNAEWDVVAGFDDGEGLFYGRGSYAGLDGYARAKQSRAKEAVNICPALGGLFIGEKTGKFDARAAELAALKEAVRHGRTPDGKPMGERKWILKEGLGAYNRWVDDWGKPDKKRDSGDSYCHRIYRSTHRAAGGFLREISPRWGKASEMLLEAAGSFEAEADELDLAERLIGWQSPAEDAARNAQLAPMLAQARDHYAKGIGAIEKALAAVA